MEAFLSLRFSIVGIVRTLVILFFLFLPFVKHFYSSKIVDTPFEGIHYFKVFILRRNLVIRAIHSYYI